jgi:hypothetical protein
VIDGTAPTTAAQLAVENYFYGGSGTNAMAATYWIGLTEVGNLYYWHDGSKINNGMVSNANPYMHISFDFHDVWTAANNCTIAAQWRWYNNYTGGHSDLIHSLFRWSFVWP